MQRADLLCFGCELEFRGTQHHSARLPNGCKRYPNLLRAEARGGLLPTRRPHICVYEFCLTNVCLNFKNAFRVAVLMCLLFVCVCNVMHLSIYSELDTCVLQMLISSISPTSTTLIRTRPRWGCFPLLMAGRGGAIMASSCLAGLQGAGMGAGSRHQVPP